MGTRPLIAVTSRRIAAERISHWIDPAQILSARYQDAIHVAGGVGAALIPQSIDEIDSAAIIRRFDGLLVIGGVDVDPMLYGQEAHPTTVAYDADVDRWEMSLIDAARHERKPILAICRGAQLLNVTCGGTLHQNLADIEGLARHGMPSSGSREPGQVIVDPATELAAAIGTEGIIGCCHHHQAVDRLGDGLVVTARAPDGVIEAFEAPDDAWTVAVQWHPEDSARNDRVQQRLFDAFVTAASGVGD